MAHRHQEHDYLPAMGNDRLLPLYDTFTWLLGVPRVHRRLVELAAIEPGATGCSRSAAAPATSRAPRAAHASGRGGGGASTPTRLPCERARRKADRAGLPVRWDRGQGGRTPLRRRRAWTGCSRR